MKVGEIELEPMSAYDRAQLLKKGMGAIFGYDNGSGIARIFRVTKNGSIFYIEDTETGFIATDHGNPTNLIDFQGAAAQLIAKNKNLVFDREGNIDTHKTCQANGGHEYKPSGGKWTPVDQRTCIDCGHTLT